MQLSGVWQITQNRYEEEHAGDTVTVYNTETHIQDEDTYNKEAFI